MKENYNTPNSNCCGRPMHYAPEKKCNYNDCCFNEYCGAMPACIKNKQPDCLAKAVIPAINVDTVEGITNLANCFVHVTSINTTYYVDDKHRPMMVWMGTVEVENYDVEENPLGLRSQICFNTTEDGVTEIYFDKQGNGHIMQTEEV